MQINENNRLILDEAAWQIVQDVQKDGNEIRWTSDMETWGMEERWDFPKTVNGKMIEDCDGITLWKMDALLKRGCPAAPLLFCICRTETGEGHAVLCITTNRGDFILDNRHRKVRSYDDLLRLGYQFLYRMRVGKNLNDVWEQIKKR